MSLFQSFIQGGHSRARQERKASRVFVARVATAPIAVAGRHSRPEIIDIISTPIGVFDAGFFLG